VISVDFFGYLGSGRDGIVFMIAEVEDAEKEVGGGGGGGGGRK
jgi:hypothetical protein